MKEKINKLFKNSDSVDINISSVKYDEKNNKFEVINTDGIEICLIDAKIEQAKEISKTDSKTNIKLESNTGVIDENTIIVVNSITDEKALNTIKESLKDISTKYTLFDIKLLLDNVEVQPNGKVKISIPIPEGYDTSKLVVYRIQEDGSKDELQVTVNNGYAEFETDHFTWYALTEINAAKSLDAKALDKEPKAGEINHIVYAYIIAIVSIGAIAIICKKK